MKEVAERDVVVEHWRVEKIARWPEPELVHSLWAGNRQADW